MSAYITPFGISGRGNKIDTDVEESFKHVHDLFLQAARNNLDIFMVCGTLRSPARGDGYVKNTGVSFVKSVERVLLAGTDVSILVWSANRKDYEVTDFQKLAKRARDYRGKLTIRASGTSEGRDHVTHFVVAKSRDDYRWIVRVEKPRTQIADAVTPRGIFAVPAAIIFSSGEAEKHGQRVMRIFNQLFNVIPTAAPQPDECLQEV